MLGIACTSFLGGIWFIKDRFDANNKEASLVWQHCSSQRTADAYLRLMDALENADTNKLEKFRTLRPSGGSRICRRSDSTEPRSVQKANSYQLNRGASRKQIPISIS